MDNVIPLVRTRNIDISDVTDLTRDRTVWRNLVQTHRQFTWWKNKKKWDSLYRNWLQCGDCPSTGITQIFTSFCTNSPSDLL